MPTRHYGHKGHIPNTDQDLQTPKLQTWTPPTSNNNTTLYKTHTFEGLKVECKAKKDVPSIPRRRGIKGEVPKVSRLQLSINCRLIRLLSKSLLNKINSTSIAWREL